MDVWLMNDPALDIWYAICPPDIFGDDEDAFRKEANISLKSRAFRKGPICRSEKVVSCHEAKRLVRYN